LSLFLNLFLNCCSGFLYSSFFHVALCNNVSFEFLKLSRCSLFCFSDKFDRYDKFIFAGCFAKYEFILVI
jgi:hypothetical protein